MNQSPDEVNQSQYKESLESNDDVMIFIEVYLLVSKPVLVVVTHSHGGSCPNRHHMPNPQ